MNDENEINKREWISYVTLYLFVIGLFTNIIIETFTTNDGDGYVIRNPIEIYNVYSFRIDEANSLDNLYNLEKLEYVIENDIKSGDCGWLAKPECINEFEVIDSEIRIEVYAERVEILKNIQSDNDYMNQAILLKINYYNNLIESEKIRNEVAILAIEKQRIEAETQAWEDGREERIEKMLMQILENKESK